MANTFHQGELKVQEMSGEALIAQSRTAMIAPQIMSGVIPFLEKQALLFLSSANQAGEVWISALLGDPGFIQVPNKTELSVLLPYVFSSKEDILFENLGEKPELGALVMDFSHRRRFRINGSASLDETGIHLGVREAYGNCPKFIQRRLIHAMSPFEEVQAEQSRGVALKESQKAWISEADTFFLGSRSKEGKMDASHRGGKQGFVQILDNKLLRVPDYPGNSMYNSLGNILEYPQVGLLFLDFEQGKTLQLSGRAELQMDQNSPDDLERSGGSGRFWTFEVEKWIETKNHHKVDWELIDYSPYNP
ncbi:MAG: pyridoxamine 5'-phosphate oxidase family protein [Bacteroidia bacterium]|nr:pyridoxamine 5'-phosphate oxidase family protein [Bacteroidia bacterium]